MTNPYVYIKTGIEEYTEGNGRFLAWLAKWQRDKMPSARVKARALYFQDAVEYTVYFDSSTWTGRKP